MLPKRSDGPRVLKEIRDEAESMTHAGTWMLDASMDHTFWSAETRRITGVGPDATAGPDLLKSIIYQDDWSHVLSSLRQALEKGTLHHIKYRIIRPDDGKKRWIECIAQRSVDPDTSEFRLIGVVQDITQQIDDIQVLQDAYAETKHYQEIADATQDLIAYIDREHRYLAINKAYARFHHLKREQIIGMSVEDVVGKENFTHIRPLLLKAAEGKKFSIKNHFQLPGSDETIYEEGTFSPYLDESGETKGIAVTIRDIRKQEEAVKQAFYASELSARYLDIAGVMILALDAEANITLINRKGCEIVGYSQEELLGKNWIDLFIPKTESAEIASLHAKASHLDDKSYSFNENEIITKSGEHRLIAWSNVVLSDEEGKSIGSLSSGTDITSLKESENRLEHMALHDALTGLGNRVMLSSQMEHAIKAAQRTKNRLALLFLDLDDFKNINDTYGHDIGDIVLSMTAERLLTSLRDDDTLIRFGGDEFVIILEHIGTGAGVATLAEKLLQHLIEPFIIEEQSYFLSVSIGIAIYPQDGEQYESLLKAADTAMYRAKDDGKNHFAFYDRSLTEALMEQMAIENSLREAIRKEQFELYYQPQLSFENGHITGFEALIRWNHPTMGRIDPDRFISIAEKSHLIIPLGEWVLTTACRQAALWHKRGIFDGHMGVNISGIQMEHGDLPGIIAKALSSSGLDPDQLEIEVTETVVMKDPQRWIDMFAEIKALGVHISIDDFGTGYSSLSYLREFPLDKLKIDRSFVEDLPHDEDACAIADTIIALAKGLGLSTIAEGVETSAQAQYLNKKACDSVQGYLFDRPLQAFDAEQRLLSGEYKISGIKG